jgi:hypothetical protein
MKNVILIISILFASATSSFAQAKMDTTQKEMKMMAKKYTCPMHPEVVKNKMGKCPKCGMALVEKKMDMKKYTCTMHPEVVKDKAGKCPKCGMKLVRTKMKEKKMDM